MRAVCYAAVAPADRRLFEDGCPGGGQVRDPRSPVWAGLEVGQHEAEQF